MDTKYPHAFFTKLTWATSIILVAALLFIQWLPLSESQRWLGTGVLLLFGLVTWVKLKLIMPRYWPASWIAYSSICVDALAIVSFDYLLGPVDLSPFYIILIINSAMIWPRNAALFAAGLASAFELLVVFMLTSRGGLDFSQVLIRSIVFAATALLVSELAAELGARWRAIAAESDEQRREIEQQRDELEGLNDIAQSFGNLEDVRETFRQVTERIAHLLDAELCILTRLDESGRIVRGMPPGYGLTDEQIARFEYQTNAEIISIWDLSRHKYVILNDPARLPPEIAHRVLPAHIRQVVAARLMRRGRPIGMIFAANRINGRAFEEKDAQLLSILAGQAAIAVENARLYASAQDNLQDVTRLYTISSRLSARSDPDLIPTRIVNAVAEALNAPMASMALLNPATGQLQYAATLGMPDDVYTLGFRENGTAMTVVRTGEPRFIEDIQFTGDVHPVTRVWGFRATACLPIQLGDKRLGILYVNYSEPHLFTDVEKNMLGVFANQAATALENARLQRVEQRKAAELETLAKLSHSLAETMDLEEMFRVIEREIRVGLPLANAGTLLVYDPVLQVLQPRAAFGYDRELLFKITMTVDESIAGRVFKASQSVIFNGSDTIREIRQQTLHADNQALLAAAAYGDIYPQSIMGVIVAYGDEKMGVIILENHHSPEAFTTEDVRLMEAMADRMALAIRNAELYRQMQEQARRDSLTQAYNHGYFLERLNAEVERAERDGSFLALIMLDVDYFKHYNDRYGHVIGDQVLGEIIRAISRHVHKTDLVGRWGGEEFSIALLQTDSATARLVANRIRETLANAKIFNKDGEPIPPPTVSQGLAVLPNHARNTAMLIDLADAALYCAKSRGRNQILASDEL